MLGKNIFIIAEIGSNHNGSLTLAKKLILTAKNCGCNAVKFQSWDETLNSDAVYKKSPNILKEYLKYKLSFQKLKILRKFAKNKKIKFGTAVFNKTQLNEAIKINCDFIKIASMDFNNYDLIQASCKTKLPLIISTGFATKKELDYGLKFIKKRRNKNITILHCVSVYPPLDTMMNLRNILMIKNKYKLNVGFSDHTIGTTASLASVPLGAEVIEKHFTTSKKLPGWDHSISADPKEMREIVTKAKKIVNLMGAYERKISLNELKQSKKMRRSIVLISNVLKGNRILKSDLDVRRPGTGLDPIKLKTIVGKKAKKNLLKGRIIKLGDF